MRHLRITIGNKSYDVSVEDVTETHIHPNPVPLPATASAPPPPAEPRPAGASAKHSGPTEPGAVVSPMAGAIKAIHVKPGDRVVASQALLILEAMKMDNQITAPVEGTVKSVEVTVGDSVQESDVLLRLE